ncbi:MAG: transglutaminase-like domain-containing protein [Planctomycetota bacterium]|nr:transglutaminase-like domain-containing protein [Planctomycetota bacterium]
MGHAATLPAQAARSTSNEASARVFESVWAEMERRYAWRILEREVHNPASAFAHLPYAWQDYDNRHAAAFREKHKLLELIAGARDDWEAILRLRHWAFMNLRDGQPSWGLGQGYAAETVDASLAGATFYCTYFAYVFVAAASACGFPARHLGIDNLRGPDEPGSHHGVADVWVNKYRKWVHVDPNYDHHYELDGVPLNAEELGQAWRRNQGQGIVGLVGLDRREVERPRAGIAGQHESACFYWHYIDTLNAVFNRGRLSWPDPVVFLVDEERKKNTWLQGRPPETYPHVRYKNGTFLTTERLADAYPDLNGTRFDLLEPGKVPYLARVVFAGSCVPNFSHHVARVDGGAPQVIKGIEFPWQLHLGENRVEFRAVNLAGHEGPPSRLAVHVERLPGREPGWPTKKSAN